MKNGNKIKSALSLEKVIFDKIEFQRLGFSSEKELEIEILSNISQREDDELYRVTLIMKGNKPEEYTFEISLSGYFSIEQNNEMTDDLKNILISKNAVAILMPYLRSEVSLLTAQPGMECIVLPVFNVNNMVNNN